MHTDTQEIRIDPALFGGLERLAEGVIGYTVEHRGALYIPVIYSTDPGHGHVGRYLDSLPRNRRVVVPNVLNSQLAGMLAHRGFREGVEWVREMREHVPIWEREADA